MLTENVEIVNVLGLHARASAKLTQLASQFESDVWLTRDQKRVNAKSIMGVMMLAASKGTVLELEVSGPDESDAMNAIKALVADKFGEGE